MIANVEIENIYVTLIMPILGWFVIRKLGLDIFYLGAKFDDSSFSRSRHIFGGLKFRMGHTYMTLIDHAPLRVICHPYAET